MKEISGCAFRAASIPRKRGAAVDHLRFTLTAAIAVLVGVLAIAPPAVAGSPAHLLKDIHRGSGGSNPRDLTKMGRKLLFFANDGSRGPELWRTRGSRATTWRVKELGPRGAGPHGLTRMRRSVFFSVDDGRHGAELWRSDGTRSGTRLVKDIAPGADGCAPDLLTKVGGTVFFAASDPRHGRELWRSDGTRAGTRLVEDIVPGSRSSRPGELTNVGGALFFSAGRIATDRAVWKSDGSRAGTRLVFEGGGGDSAPLELTRVGEGALFFVLYSEFDREPGDAELWTSDGTRAGTRFVKDLSYSVLVPPWLTDVDGTLFFFAADGLWGSDGTRSGTRLVSGLISDGELLTNVGGTLYLGADDGIHGEEPWRSDGTTLGTALVKDIDPGADGSLPTYGFSDRFDTLNFRLANVADTVFFPADDGSHGQEPWRSDGSSAGTELVDDVRPGPEGSFPRWLTSARGRLFFSADDGAHGNELWRATP